MRFQKNECVNSLIRILGTFWFGIFFHGQVLIKIGGKEKNLLIYKILIN